MSVRAKIFLITFSLLALATGGGGLFIQYQLTGYLNDDVNSNLENHAKIAQKLFICFWCACSESWILEVLCIF